MHEKKRRVSEWCKWAGPASAVAAAVTMVALLWSFPLILAPASVLMGFAGDSLSTLQRWESWQASVRYIERPLLNAAGRALATSIGPVPAYNFLVLLSFPLSAMAAYALCRRIVAHAPSAMLGAMVLALSPFHWAHSLGHIYEAHIQWIPLLAVAALSFAANPGVMRFLFLALAAALLIGSSFYYGFFVAVVAAPLAVAGCVLLLARRRGRRLIIATAAVAGIVLATLPITHSYLVWLSRLRAPFLGNAEDLIRYSARIGEYVRPGPFSALRRVLTPVTIPGTLHLSNEVEQSLFVGWVPLALAAIGIGSAVGGRHGNGLRRGEFGWIIAAGFIAAVCSSPPEVRVGQLVVRMPSHYLAYWVPFFRTYARMAVIVMVAVSCAAAVGCAVVAERHPRLAMLAAVLILVEFAPLPPTRVVRIFPLRGAHAWIARRGGGQAVLEYPLDSRATPRTSVRAYLAGLTGWASAEEVGTFDVRHPGTIGEVLARNLAMEGVAHLFLHDRNPDPPLQVYKDRPARGANMPGEWPPMEAGHEMALTAHFPETVVFTLRKSGSCVSLRAGDGISPWLEGQGLVGRSMLPRSSIVLQNDAPWPCPVDLQLDIVPVTRLDGWRVTLNGTLVGECAMRDTVRLDLHALEALPGENLVGIEALADDGTVLSVDGPIGRLLGARINNVPAPVPEAPAAACRIP